MSTVIDPITTAYVVKGAIMHPDFTDNTQLLWVDEIEVMQFLIEQADTLERAYEASELDFSHLVFAYEIAEPFGRYLITCIGKSGRYPPPEEVATYIQQVLNENGIP